MTQPDIRPAVAAHDARPAEVPLQTGDVPFDDANQPHANPSPAVTTRSSWLSMRRPGRWVVLAMAIPLVAAVFVLLTMQESESPADAPGSGSQIARSEVASPHAAVVHPHGAQHRQSAIRRTSPNRS